MFRKNISLTKKLVILNILSNTLIPNLVFGYPIQKSENIFNTTNNESITKKINTLDIEYLNSKRTLAEYIIDTGDALYIEFENKPGGLKEKNVNLRDPNNVSYLNPKTNLDNYLLDENDSIFINFLKTPELNTTVTVDKEGEVNLPRIKTTYIRGLTIDQLSNLLESRYKEFLIDPEIEIEISKFKFISSGVYQVDLEGEMFLPLIRETFVRGLTPIELSNLLEKRYSEFGISAKTTVKVARFKPIRVLVDGEIRSPGIYEFPGYTVGDFISTIDEVDENERVNEKGNQNTFLENEIKKTSINEFNIDLDEEVTPTNNNIDGQVNNANNNFEVKRPINKITTISNAILKAGGITSRTDLSRIQIIRDLPIGSGGGKKRAFIDFSSYINDSDTSNDIRLFDGDRIFFSRLSEASKDQIPKSILSGLSPKFISVNVNGRIENRGNVLLPLEATLSDAINLSGPIKPLSGKIVLIRYNKDGTVLKKDISYAANAKRGTERNPFVLDGDLITVKNSVLGKSTGIIKEITAPFIGIYSTLELID